MGFEVGQKYVSKNDPARIGSVVKLDDGDRRAWIEMRNPEGDLLDSAWVVYVQFIGAWTLLSNN